MWPIWAHLPTAKSLAHANWGRCAHAYLRAGRYVHSWSWRPPCSAKLHGSASWWIAR